MRHFNKQPDQDLINEKLLNDFYLELDFDRIEWIGINTWLPTFLKYFTHSDTYFHTEDDMHFVRIQGWLKFPDGDYDLNLYIPHCEFECISTNGIFISSILVKAVNETNEKYGK